MMTAGRSRGSFSRARDFRVTEARTGPEALRVLRSERPDILLLDIIMPELNGWDVARTVRADPSCTRDDHHRRHGARRHL